MSTPGGNPGDPNLPRGITAHHWSGGVPVGLSVSMGFQGGNLPGRTLAEKVSIFQKARAREAAAFAAPHLEGQRLAAAAAAATPAPAPAPVALADLAGSVALADSSLDPFLSPATLSTDENVLVPYDAALGTLPIGDQAPTLVPSVLEEPDVFNPQTGFVEPETTFAQGGAVMPGLGFRPLGYAEAGLVENPVLTNPVSQNAPDTLEYQFLREVEKGEKFALAFAQTYKNELMSMLQNDAFDRTQTAQIFAQMLGSGRLEGTPIGAGMDMPYPIPEEAAWGAPAGAGMDMPYPPPSIPVGEDLTETLAVLTNPPQGTSPVGPQYQAGGYVGRGTMAGELGRRGDLSVRQAGETMFERMKRLRGYANGGYADGYHTPRGTMAGELAPKGSLPVRVAGESMGELHKRHQDQDWYNRMGGGLGSLGRRRGVA